MKIIVLDGLTLGDVRWEKFRKFGEIIIYDTTEYKETIEKIKDADIVITNKVIIDKNVIDNAKKLKFIQVAATGTNNVDIKYAESKGVIVKNVVGYSTESVAQLTFALVLGLICKIKYFDNYTKSKYPNGKIFTHIQEWFEIKGKRWGIIGLGNIGKRVALLAESFGAEVVYYSTSGINFNNNFKRLELKELLKTSKIISIHAPLNENTKNLLNYNKLKLIQEGSILINVGRGGIINEKDLEKILNEKNIFVGLDVYEKEPLDKDNPILKFNDNILLTPHIAWTSKEALERLINFKS